MIKSLIYKEWLKTSKIIVCLALFLAGFTAYDFLALSKNAELQGYGFLWSYAVGKKSILVENLIYLPVICGMVLAAVQFIPESYRKCIKLTLHLPISQTKTIMVIQGYGICVLSIMFIVQSVALFLFLNHYLVVDIVWRILFSFLTWYSAGLCAYIWISAICLEPNWRMKFTELVITFVILSSFYLSPQSMAYHHSILSMFIVTTLSATLLIHYSVKRFKDGVQ